jgi:hypothetical protein
VPSSPVLRRRARSLVFLVSILLSLPPAAYAPIVSAAAAGSALSFNGSNQYATLGSTTDLRLPQFTLELWVRRSGAGVGINTGTGGLASAIPLITKGRAEAETAAADVNYFFGIDATTGHLAADFEEAQSGATPSLNHPITGTGVIAADNTWHHVAATYDGATWNLYLDGNLDGTLLVGATRPPNTATAVTTAVGTSMNSSGTAAGFFAGTVDEVRIWSVARTQAQIQAAKNQELTSGTGLVGRWGLNEGTGSSLANSVAGGVSGTAVASPSWVAGFPIPDTTPPARPTGLAATAYPAAVALAWSSNSESDLAGYNVYRSTTSPVTTGGGPLNGTLLASAS